MYISVAHSSFVVKGEIIKALITNLQIQTPKNAEIQITNLTIVQLHLTILLNIFFCV